MNRSVIVAAAVGLALLAGCGQSPEPSPPPTSEDALTTATTDVTQETETAPTTEAPETEEAEAEGPPQMPDAAKEQTEEGAEAFVEYYIQTVNAGHLGNATADDVRALAADSCETCSAFAEVIETQPFGSRYMDFLDATPVLLSEEARVETEVEQVSDGSKIQILFTLGWGDGAWHVSKIQSVR